MQTLTCSTNDVGSHVTAIESWDQEYYQLSPGKIVGNLDFVSFERCHLFVEGFNQKIAQYGCVPDGYVGIAALIPFSDSGPSTIQGVELNPGSLYVVGPNQEFATHTGKNARILTFAISLEYLLELAEFSFPAVIDQIDKKVIEGSLLITKCRSAASLVGLSSNLHSLVTTYQISPASLKINVHTTVEMILESIMNTSTHLSREFIQGVRCEIVRRSRDYALELGGDVSILEICKKLKISRGTLQSSFKYVAGESPQRYLRSILMGKIKDELQENDSASIKDVAYSYGFFHLGRFSAYYKELFGELPSHTTLSTRIPY